MAALEVTSACLELQLRVPEDVAIVGYDDIEFIQHLRVPLTSIRQPMREMGQAAGELLVTRKLDHLVFEPQLIVRSST